MGLHFRKTSQARVRIWFMVCFRLVVVRRVGGMECRQEKEGAVLILVEELESQIARDVCFETDDLLPDALFVEHHGIAITAAAHSGALGAEAGLWMLVAAHVPIAGQAQSVAVLSEDLGERGMGR